MYDEAIRILCRYGELREWMEKVEACLERLPESQRLVLEAFFVQPEGETSCLMEEELEVARSTVYRIKNRALRNISRDFELAGVAFF